MLSNHLSKQIKYQLKRYLQHSPNFNTVTLAHVTSLCNLLFDTTDITEPDILIILNELKYPVKHRHDSIIIACKRWSFNIFIQIVYVSMYLREVKFLNHYNIRYLEILGLQKFCIDIFCFKCNLQIELVTRYNKYPNILYENILFAALDKGLGIIEDEDSHYLFCPICYASQKQIQRYPNNYFDHKKLNLQRQLN